MIIGQDKLLNYINNFNSINDFPHSLMLLGNRGSGKHTISKYIAEKFNLDIIDISNELSLELIDEIMVSTELKMYLLDTDIMNIKQQTTLLKFLEEPPQNAYLILIGKNRTNILPTIINRCVVMQLEEYSNSVLETFIEDNVSDTEKKLIIEVCKTPGIILSTNLKNVLTIKELCDKIILKLDKASLPNTLTITSKINFKDEYDKFDIDIFCNMLLNELFNYTQTNIKYLKEYNIVKNYTNKIINDSRLNKQNLIELMLIELWEEVRK